MILSRLLDDTLYRLSDDGVSEVFVDGKWLPSDGVTVGDVSASKPLTEAETAKLISEGILQPTKSSQKSQPAFSNNGRKPPPGSGFQSVQEFDRYLLRGLDKR